MQLIWYICALGANNFRSSMCFESLVKIKGHVKEYFAQIGWLARVLRISGAAPHLIDNEEASLRALWMKNTSFVLWNKIISNSIQIMNLVILFVLKNGNWWYMYRIDVDMTFSSCLGIIFTLPVLPWNVPKPGLHDYS